MNVYEAFIVEVEALTINASAPAVEVVGVLTRAVKRAQMKVDEQSKKPYNENGDMVTRMGQVFRQIGWRIDGGPKDGMLFSASMTEEEIRDAMEEPHGGVTPIYVEVGTD